MSLVTRKVDDRSRVVLPETFTGRTVVVESVALDEVRIRIVKPPRRRPSLDSLLSLVTEENQHDPVEFGPATGNEAI